MELTTTAGEVFNVYIVGAEEATKSVLIIHDWWGVLDYNREWANQFAQKGYRAMVIDLYKGYHPKNVKEAGEYMRSIDQEVANQKLQTALNFLKTPHCKVATLGWSFGGLQAQQATLKNPEKVDATVLYYCRIIFDRQNAINLRGAVLAIFAETERTWPDKQVALEHVMSELDKTLVCYSYDAGHGFANPDSPHYDSEVTEEAWQMTVNFLDEFM
jgi:carboxymethylenebutenolidase